MSHDPQLSKTRDSMRVSVLLVALGSCCAVASEALACGGGFGEGIEIEASQRIAIGFRDGVETYVFAPEFCGPASDFGLVLPITGKLQGDPALAPEELFAVLAKETAPEVVTEEICIETAAGSDAGIADDGTSRGGGGARVVGAGKVDIFEWVELTAADASELTAWLDANGFPYDSASTTVFADYVRRGFGFVAFKVSQGAASTCGVFGPISLRFAAATPVVPVRIAAAHADAAWRWFSWDVFVVASEQMRAQDGDGVASLHFSGEIDAAMLRRSPALSSLGRLGDRLTQLRLEFGGDVRGDLSLAPDAAPADYRRKETEETFVLCDEADDRGGLCSAARTGEPRLAAAATCALALALVVRRRRRRA